MKEILNFLSDPIVAAYIQTITGIIVGSAAIWIAIKANSNADKQFKENLESAEKFNTKTLNELERISKVIGYQLDATNRHHTDILNTTKPIVKYKLHLNGYYRNQGTIAVNIEVNNEGKRAAKDLSILVYFIDKEFTTKRELYFIEEKYLYSDNILKRCSQEKINESDRYLFFKIAYTDEELGLYDENIHYYENESENQPLFKDITNNDAKYEIKEKMLWVFMNN